jgi:hypothetical protein
MDKTQFTTEGALFELINRGKKDNFFFRDSFNDTLTNFDTRYEFVPPIVQERRITVPRNGAEFGQTCEFEFEVAGDVITAPSFLIQLPSWVPAPNLTQVQDGFELTTVDPSLQVETDAFYTTARDASGVSYGWTNGVGYFLFSNIQVYQDNLLLQEFSGDALYATRLSRGTFTSGFLDTLQTGQMPVVDAENISKNAAPGLLRLTLPFIGCQAGVEGGFPSIAVRQQSYKIRATLRRAEDLVLASDGRAKPVPWDREMYWEPPQPAPRTQGSWVQSQQLLQTTATTITSSIYYGDWVAGTIWAPNPVSSLQFRAAQADQTFVMGLGVILPTEFNRIQYAFYVGSDGRWLLINNYAFVDISGSYTTDTLFAMQVVGPSIQYIVDGTVVNTISKQLAYYFPSASIYQPPVTIQDIVLVEIPPTDKEGIPAFHTLTRTAMPGLTIQLETRHVYTDAETQVALQKQRLQIPFSRLYENKFTFGPLDYAPLAKAAAAVVTRRLDAVHPASRVVWFFRKRDDLMANRYDALVDLSGAEYYNSVSLVIAGRERESAWGPMVWNHLVAHAKEDCDPGPGLGVMNWDLPAGQVPTRHEPEGSINFTTADRPTFLIDLSAAGAAGSQYVEMSAIVDTWTLFTADSGRGALNVFT